jgi:hypothetical protein
MSEGRIIRKHVDEPKNIGEVRTGLAQMYADVSNDRAMVPQADTAANVAGKIYNICKLELELMKLTGKKHTSSFLKM